MCPTCKGTVDVKSHHVVVVGATVRVYCSAICLEERDVVRADPAPVEQPVPHARRSWWWVVSGLLGTLGTGGVGLALTRSVEAEAPPAPMIEAPAELVQLADGVTETVDDRRRAAEDALIVDMMGVTWVHPLAGPTRRMPVTHNGAFGAERPGERPLECVSGHCGVDLGQSWGEPVYAVHEGVVDFVQRSSNDDHGGIFVRIGHRDGSLFSWYFHLAAVPRAIQPGTEVSAGTMIGLLGDTGVKHSSPHLHFALSVRYAKNHERYLDPEPLIALWPLWLPNETRTGGRLLSSAFPGVPMRQHR